MLAALCAQKITVKSPSDTVELLDRLVDLGLTDEIFDIVHHFNEETIAQHRNYCSEHPGRFQPGGTNEQVQRRLKIMLNAYVAGGFTNVNVFRYLAHASVTEIPYDETSGT